MEQQIEGMESEVVTYTFTAMNEDGLCIWGAKNASDEMLANIVLGRIDLPETALADLSFETAGPWGAQIAYTSSNEAVISNNGTFSAPAAETEVTITVRVTVGEATVEKQFVVTCLPSAFISEMLPDAIADDGHLAAAEPAAGGTIAPVAGISQYTGVSITFRVKDVGSDWDVIFRTPNAKATVYLSVLNYNNANTFEAEATLSEEGKQFLTENGYGVTGFNHVIFLDEVEANQENGSVATISYNVDGTITFYRNGVLMLTYAADTEIGSSTVRNLSAYMIAQIRTQGLSVVYPVSNVIVGYAADYDESKVPEERPVKETIGTDNGDGTYTLAFDTWYLEQEVKGDFKVMYDINVKAPKLLATGDNWYNWLVKIGDWKLRSDRYSMNGASGNADLGSAVQYTGTPADWAVFRQNYFDADVILTIQRTGVKVVVTADVTSLSTGDEFIYTATYANFGPDNTTVSLGGEDCLISVYEVTAESGQEPVEPSHEHSFGAYVDDVATCECGATKVKYVVGSTTAEVVFESRENAEVVTNTDTSGVWWDSDPMGQKQISGDFAVQYSWKNTEDANWYQDVVLELTDGSLFFSKNFLISAPISNDSMLWTGTPITTVTCSDGSASIPTQPTTETVLGDYTASIVRIGDTLIVTQVAELDSGITWKVVDRYEGFTENDLTVQINGNPYFADDLRVTVGEMKKTTETLVNETYENPTAFQTWYEVPEAISFGQTLTVWGTQNSAMAENFHTVVWEIRQGFTGRFDAFGWTFDPNNEYGTKTKFGAYSVISKEVNGESVDTVGWDQYREIGKKANYTVTFAWETIDTLMVTVLLENGSDVYECIYALPIIDSTATEFNVQLTAEAVNNFTVNGYSITE